MSPRNQRRKEDRPDEIIAAAFESFAERGYADTKVEQVAKRAGVSKGLVYLYFKTKEELFKAVVGRFVVPRFDNLEKQLSTPDLKVSEFLRGPFVNFATDMVESPLRYVARMLIAEGPKHPDLLAYYHQAVISRGISVLRRFIELGIKNGEFRPNPLLDYPQLLITPMIFTVMWKNLFDPIDPLPVRQFLNAHMELLLTAVENNPKVALP